MLNVTVRGLLGVFGGLVAGLVFLVALDYEPAPTHIGFVIMGIFALVYLDRIESNTQQTRDILERIADRTK